MEEVYIGCLPDWHFLTCLKFLGDVKYGEEDDLDEYDGITPVGNTVIFIQYKVVSKHG